MPAPIVGMRQPLEAVSKRTAHLSVAILFGWLALSQAVDIRRTQLTGLSPNGDPFGEADAIRSADHYLTYGFTTDFGLPHVTYGARFRDVGDTAGPVPLRSDVYVTYPPLPNLLCGVFARIFGIDRLWLWRCMPVLVTLVATLVLWRCLEPVLGDAPAAVVTLLASAPPMVSGYMDGLQYHAYAHALLLIELGLLTQMWLTERLSRGRAALLFVIGFIQGWLSFEYAFIVAGAAIPLAVLAREHRGRVAWMAVLVAVTSVGAGFAIALALHFVQVAAFFGSVKAAAAMLGTRAFERIYGFERDPARATSGSSYAGLLALALFRYAKLLWLSPNDRHFGIFLPAFSIWLLLGARRAGGWLRNSEVLALVSAYVIAALWLVVMPSHSIIHMHFVPRIFFLAYFVAALGVAVRISKWRAA